MYLKTETVTKLCSLEHRGLEDRSVFCAPCQSPVLIADTRQ